ncbi:hypothetical protein [Pseudaestuariivita sp.]|uniref:hypothetical protein n=1 Tax=Pseudaestuariivita sp. TaxID=2211669 RepID=UPI004059435E
MDAEIYGTPDAKSPELTEADFAKARRRATGKLVDPEAYARQTLIEMRASLGREDDAKIKRTLRHVEAALAELQEG